MDSIKERVKKTISQYNMLEFDSKIAIGVSGGKDSVGLLKILAEIEKERPRAELVAISVDEGIRGYREEALRIAKNVCSKIGVDLHIVSFRDLFGITMEKIALELDDLTPCSYCGVLRRRALNETAKMINADTIATAHNLDDVVQTILLNFLRGDTIRFSMMAPGGLDSPIFVRRVKPYCQIPENESTFYSYLSGFDIQSISCPYSTEAMRNDIRSFLNMMESKRPGTKFSILRTASKLSFNLPDFKMNDCVICGEPTRNEVCRVCEILSKFQ
jgi:uncharacterized protein (TIGR00269 family)